MGQRASESQGRRQRFWQQHIDAWFQSGESQRRYCQTQGIALATFGYWRRKLKNEGTEKPHFSPLAENEELAVPGGRGVSPGNCTTG